ncbi:MAG: hypothetical protein KDB74_00840, partial [Flavobacteriales bacterium]|nr:hypothetical protein [Flavobacteriales bacterium]
MTSQGKLFKNLTFFFSVPIDSISMAEKSNGTIRTTLLDTTSINLSNKIFYNVVHFKYGIPEYKYEIWIAKNVGLLKYYNPGDSTTWELIKYHIN